jgi:hypothetical protein
MDESIVLPEQDEGLGAELNQGINEFNARATWIGDGRLLHAELRDDEGCSRGRANWLDVGPSQTTMDTRRSVRGGHICEAPKLSTSGHHRFRRSRQGPPAHRRRVGDVIWVVHVPWQ